MEESKTFIAIVLFLVVFVFLAGRGGEKTEYVCFDGSITENASACPKPEPPKTTSSVPATETTAPTTTVAPATTTTVVDLCSNLIQDGGELGIDCGGGCNKPCTYSSADCRRDEVVKHLVGRQKYVDSLRGLYLRDGVNYCVVNRTVLDSDDNRLSELKLFYDETVGVSADIIEEYDVYGMVVGVAGGYLSTSYLNNAGDILYSASCVDGVTNQGEAASDCGGPCLPCPVKNATLWVSRPDVAWYVSSKRGRINEVDFELTNTGDINITPIFDIKIYREPRIFKKEIINAKSTLEDPVAPGEKVRGNLRIRWYTYTRAEYEVEVSVRDGSSAEVLVSRTVKATITDS